MDRFERAAQLWAVLGWAARNRQTITYQDLGRLIGVPAPGLGHLLEPIQAYCLKHDRPPLTALVVSKNSGLPGSGFVGATADVLGRAQEAVFRTNWVAIGTPLPETFRLEASAQGAVKA